MNLHDITNEGLRRGGAGSRPYLLLGIIGLILLLLVLHLNGGGAHGH